MQSLTQICNKETNLFSENTYLSRETFNCVKGYLAICVFVHHLFQFTGLFWDTFIGYPLYLLGHFSVVLFLFVSGFGLSSSIIAKSDSYIKTFPRKRLLPFYITYLFFVTLYVVFELIMGGKISGTLFLKSLFYGGTYISFGWYFQLTLVLYIVFYFIYRTIHKTLSRLLSLWIFVFMFIGIGFFVYPPESTYLYVFAFAIGISLAYLRDRMTVLISSHPYICSILMTSCYIITTILRVLFLYRNKPKIYEFQKYNFMYLILISISDIFLILMVITCLYLICKTIPRLVINPISKALGKYSLEMYAMQGLVLRLFNGVFKNTYVYIGITVCVTIVMAVALQKVIFKIKNEGVFFFKKKGL